MASPSPTSGKKTVFALFALALTMALILFLVGLREKHERLEGSSLSRKPSDTAALDPEMRVLLDSLPKEWTRISFIEGQGWVIFSPCNAEPGALHITDSSGIVSLQCEFCDSLDDARVFRVRHSADRVDLDLGPSGAVSMERVTENAAAHFPKAPVKGFVLTWRSSAVDSMLFVPASGDGKFDTLRAEDENPEGCDGKKED